MKKIILSCLTVLFYASLLAQSTYTNSNRSSIYRTRPELHLQFLGLQINGNGNDFRNLLESRGFKFNTVEDTDCQRGAGSYGKVAMDNIILNTDRNNNVFGITLNVRFSTYSTTCNQFNMLDSYLRQEYPDAVVTEYFDNDVFFNENVYTIGDLGSIILKRLTDDFGLILDFTDRQNHERMLGKKTDTEWYDIRSFLPESQVCLMGIAENEILFKMTISGMQYTMAARGNDMNNILYILDNSTDLSKLKVVINRYLVKGLHANQDSKRQMTYIYRDEILPICKQICEERDKQLAAKGSLPKSAKDLFLDMIIGMVFTKKEQEIYDGLMGRDGLRAVTRAGLGIATGGSNSAYSCSTCGATFTNQGDLRAHENAYHDY